MLWTVASALLCALFLTSASLTAYLAGPGTRNVAHANNIGAPAAPASTVFGRVRAVETNAAFDPFGEIVPLPVFRPEQFTLPAFDPDLYRGGRAGEPLTRAELCDVLNEVAEEFDLPAALFVRLIWQESRFRNEAVSKKGAAGIAQFMPRTAELRGLEDPFDPLQSLAASANFLRELRDQFGNFGLAAAAYNGGPTRVRRWIEGGTRLPKETRDYVLRITGRVPEYWRRAADAAAHPDAFKIANCEVKTIRTNVPARN